MPCSLDNSLLLNQLQSRAIVLILGTRIANVMTL
jgi:hypothetical protein